jgi:MurNAc alpha-1-phosphate uridylyltransferase
MLLAAGRGERMRPLTDAAPKPLLQVHGKPLMQWHLEALAAAGCPQCVINTAWLGEQIESTFGQRFPAEQAAPGGCSMALAYSREGADFGGALETAGGIARALPSLGEVFWVLAGDVYAPGFAFDSESVQRFVSGGMLAHLWLVPNPDHNPQGDFGLNDWRALNLPGGGPQPRYTYSTIGIYRRALFEAPWCDIPAGNPQGARAALAPLLRRAMDAARVSAEIYTGAWTDVGTPERLARLNA